MLNIENDIFHLIKHRYILLFHIYVRLYSKNNNNNNQNVLINASSNNI